MCIGDSITFGRGEVPTKGWVGRLKQYFEDKEFSEVYNLGVPGDTSIGIKGRIDVELKHRIKYRREGDKFHVIISIGTNDSYGKEKEENMQVPIENYKTNLKQIVETTKKYTQTIILLTLPPVDEKLTLPFEPNFYSNRKIEEYNTVIKSIASEYNCKLYDIYPIMKESNYESLLYDGLHPNSKGYDLMFEFIKNNLIDDNLID